MRRYEHSIVSLDCGSQCGGLGFGKHWIWPGDWTGGQKIDVQPRSLNYA